MRHRDTCKSWLYFHPYDCPECKLIDDLVMTNAVYTFDEIEEIRRDAYNEGYDEAEFGQPDESSIREDALNEAIDAVRSLL